MDPYSSEELQQIVAIAQKLRDGNQKALERAQGIFRKESPSLARLQAPAAVVEQPAPSIEPERLDQLQNAIGMQDQGNLHAKVSALESLVEVILKHGVTDIPKEQLFNG